MHKIKTAITSTEIENYGNSFWEIDGYSDRLKHGAHLEKVHIPAGVMCFKNVSYDSLFLVHGEDYCVLDLNNDAIIKKKYGRDVFLEKSIATKPFNRGFVKVLNPYVLVGGMLNYWHWINNFLPRLFLVRDFFGNDFSKINVIVHDNISQAQLNHLAMLGVGLNQVVYASVLRDVVIDQLYVPTFFNNKFYCRAVADSYKAFFSDFVKNDFASALSNNAWDRVYLSRQRSRGRRVYNQDALQDVLDSYGFETIFSEELSEVEQFLIFNSANIVVSPHGAGLANLNFSESSAKVIVFEYKKGVSEMKNLSLALGMDVCVIECEQRPNHNKENRLFDLLVDIEEFEVALRKFVE